jgi:dihydroorotate dehydrogenase
VAGEGGKGKCPAGRGRRATLPRVWYPAIRPALFALDPERAHRLALAALGLAGRRRVRLADGPAIERMGLRFPNPVGLAAGFDKNAIAVDGLGALGFGFIEVGTVTPRPQRGQPRPRLFRLPAARALVNRLGFPNDGAAAVAARLAARRYPGIVGVNIGKNAATPLAGALDDYLACARLLRPVADYLVVNVSSPNTPGLRELQAPARLGPILSALKAELGRGRRVPLLAKLSPDLTPEELAEIAALVRALPLDGVVAVNTTLDRAALPPGARVPDGGLSGAPLAARALASVGALRQALGPALTIVGVGGIDSAGGACALRAAGADLVQLFTGLVYRGPALIRECRRALAAAPVGDRPAPDL